MRHSEPVSSSSLRGEKNWVILWLLCSIFLGVTFLFYGVVFLILDVRVFLRCFVSLGLGAHLNFWGSPLAHMRVLDLFIATFCQWFQERGLLLGWGGILVSSLLDLGQPYQVLLLTLTALIWRQKPLPASCLATAGQDYLIRCPSQVPFLFHHVRCL